MKEIKFWKRALIGSGSVLALTLCSFDSGNVVVPGLGDRAIASSDTSNVNKSIMQRLAGRWQDIGEGGNSQLIFTADGKVCLPTPRGAMVLYYKITNVTTQATYQLRSFELDQDGSEIPAGAEFTIEFIDDTQIRVSGGEFTSILQKISEETSFPRDAYDTTSEETQAREQIKAKENAARSSVGTISRGQQAFFLENNRFASTIQDLELGIQDSSDYHYEVSLVSSDQAIATATAKEDGLKSFSGLVYTVRTSDGISTRAKLCQTETSFKVPPACSRD